MPRLIIILIVICLLFYLAYNFKRIQADKQKQLIRNLLLFIVVLGLILLTVTGRLNWLIALVAAIIPLLPKLFSSLMRIMPGLLILLRNIQSVRSAKIVTDFLKISISRSTGEIKGQVLKGRFKGRMLSAMNKQELLSLLEICLQQDKESAASLMAYLNHYHQGWNEGKSHSAQGFESGAMTPAEARDILAVKEKAERKDIIQAHRKLMQKMHPDRGGSDYLAAKINQAKNVLLDELASKE